MAIPIPARTLAGIEERAVIAATQQHNADTGEDLTPEAYIASKMEGFIGAMVGRYTEGVKNSFVQDFEQASPQLQQLFLAGRITLAQLRGEEPIGPTARKKAKKRVSSKRR